MTMNDWPSGERPREKLLLKGAESLSDAELLAIFLRTGVKGKTALDLGRELLAEFGNLRRLLAAKQQQFCSKNGIGVAKYVTFQAALELGKRFLHESIQQTPLLCSSAQTKQYLTAQLRDKPFEVFACLFLDSQHRIILYEELFQGTLDCAPIYPRVVAHKALEYNAAAVIFAHNHPSGKASPSYHDKETTHQLIQALRSISVRVIDHIIVGEGEAFSFAEAGLLP